MLIMKKRISNKGFVLILSMLFVVMFAALGTAMMSMAQSNTQVASNHHESNMAINSALSGLELGKYYANTFASTVQSSLSQATYSDKRQTWQDFCSYVIDRACGGNWSYFETYQQGAETIEKLSVPVQGYGNGNFNFTIEFYQIVSDANRIYIQSIGSDGNIERTISMAMAVSRDNRALEYAIASRGRIWITSQIQIDGDIYSSWDATVHGSTGVKTSSAVINNGTISVSNSLDELDNENIQMETLDANDNPMFDQYGNRIYSIDDELQGYHEGVIYDQSTRGLPGLNEDDYDTGTYKSMCTSTIPSSYTTKEYFPHQEGDYTASKAGSKTLYRHVYENETFTDAILPKGRNALFKNCTFEGVLFIESQSYTTQTSNTNNVRFNNCQFNGVIVSDVPRNNNIKWRENSLYFTGGAIFQNQWSQQEATIMAPNFNVNLGNTTMLESGQQSTIKGAVIGGIVDVRGIVDIDGTIISMYDTVMHPGGYVTNIGSTDNDGGSEGGAFSGEDIKISPSQEQLLPAGINADVIIMPMQQTYEEKNIFN